MTTYFPIFRRHKNQEPVAEDATSAPEVDPHLQVPPGDINEDYHQAATSLLIFPSPSSVPPTPSSTNDALPTMRPSGPSLRDSIAHISNASLSNFSLPTSVSIDSNSASPWSTSQASLPSQKNIHHIRKRQENGIGDKREAVSTTSGERMRVESTTSSAAYSSGLDWENIRLSALEVELESASEVSGEVEVWEWSSAQDSSPTGEQAHPRFTIQPSSPNAEQKQESAWPLYFRTRTTSQFTHVSQASQSSNFTHFSHSTQPSPTQIIPHAPLHLPLLSLIQQLFGIDPETAILLTHSSSADCDLFLSSPFDLTSEKTTEATDGGNQSTGSTNSLEIEKSHRFLTIFSGTPNEKTALNTVRNGIRIAAEYAPQTSSLRLIVTPFSLLPSSSLFMNILYSPVNLTSNAVQLAVSTINSSAQCIASGTGNLFGAVTRPFTRAPVAN